MNHASISWSLVVFRDRENLAQKKIILDVDELEGGKIDEGSSYCQCLSFQFLQLLPPGEAEHLWQPIPKFLSGGSMKTFDLRDAAIAQSKDPHRPPYAVLGP